MDSKLARAARGVLIGLFSRRSPVLPSPILSVPCGRRPFDLLGKDYLVSQSSTAPPSALWPLSHLPGVVRLRGVVQSPTQPQEVPSVAFFRTSFTKGGVPNRRSWSQLLKTDI